MNDDNKNRSAAETTIVEFFRTAELWLEDETEDCLDVQNLEDCRKALLLHLVFAICDDEAVVENEVDEGNDSDPEEILDEYYAALRNPEIAEAHEEIWIMNLHQAAELLGTTVNEVLNEHDPMMER